jgi:hypothetical protein
MLIEDAPIFEHSVIVKPHVELPPLVFVLHVIGLYVCPA